ncbi:MAG: hypothetical protein PHC61_04690, partial [Chitinivibrionales bacterium]|nr:hypothetical protein [Chitinivibrionales bacterium]
MLNRLINMMVIGNAHRVALLCIDNRYAIQYCKAIISGSILLYLSAIVFAVSAQSIPDSFYVPV